MLEKKEKDAKKKFHTGETIYDATFQDVRINVIYKGPIDPNRKLKPYNPPKLDAKGYLIESADEGE